VTAPGFSRRIARREHFDEAIETFSQQAEAGRLRDISRDALRCKLKKFGLIRGYDEDAQSGAAEDQ
jgi:hypothetical protein